MKQWTIEEAIEAYRNGDFVIVADDEDREDEGDLFIAAEKITPEKMGFMIRYTSGVLCVPMEADRLEALHLPMMVNENMELNRAAFTVSVDYRHNMRSGISAEERCRTVRALVDPDSKPADFVRPGHIFPLRYKKGGVLKRAGHTEAAVDMSNLAGLYPASVLGEIVNDDGSMMRGPELQAFSEEHGIPFITVADIIRYRRKKEKLVTCQSSAKLPTEHGNFTAYVYESALDGIDHLALVMGDVREKENVLVRVHSECLTGDIFGSRRCDCGNQLQMAMKKIAEEGSGIIVYLRGHEGRGIGLSHKLKAYQLQDKGFDTVEANLELGLPVDSREYGIGAQILADFGVKNIRLLTNNPSKYGGLQGYDLKIVERVPLHADTHDDNRDYLMTKKSKLGHLLDLSEQLN